MQKGDRSDGDALAETLTQRHHQQQRAPGPVLAIWGAGPNVFGRHLFSETIVKRSKTSKAGIFLKFLHHIPPQKISKHPHNERRCNTAGFSIFCVNLKFKSGISG